MVYGGLALAHLLSVLVFFGNIVAAFLLHIRARRTGEPGVLAQLYGAMNAGERWITPPSVFVMISSGIAMSLMRDLSITRTGWIIWSLTALGVSGVLLMVRLLPLQHRLEANAVSAASGSPFDLKGYRRDQRAWSLWATISTSAALCAVVLMVLRPGIPGF